VSRRKDKKQKSTRRLYIALLLWLTCCGPLPMYTIGGIIAAGLITYAGSKLIDKLIDQLFDGKKKQAEPYIPYTQPQQTAQPASTYGPEVDSIIADGNRAMAEMGRLYASIENPEIKRKINELMRVSDKIVQDAIHDPSDVPQIRKFLDYYLPTTIKLLNAYDRMDAQGIQGENIDGTKQNILEMLDTAIEAFKKQLDSLFANQALDIETDIDVMNTMLRREGLAGGSMDDFKLH
jgi:hypothetical protein